MEKQIKGEAYTQLLKRLSKHIKYIYGPEKKPKSKKTFEFLWTNGNSASTLNAMSKEEWELVSIHHIPDPQTSGQFNALWRRPFDYSNEAK